MAASFQVNVAQDIVTQSAYISWHKESHLQHASLEWHHNSNKIQIHNDGI